MAVYRYLGGLPIGTAQDDVDVRVADCCLHFAHQPSFLHHRHGQRQPWAYDLILSDIANVAVDAAAHQLVIDALIGGGNTSVMLSGKPAELALLRQMTLQARGRMVEHES